MSIYKNDPLVTFALFSFNQERYIEAAVQGALQQDYTNLEIILSDDSSKDKTFEIIQRLAKNYSGCHKIIVNRNPSNVGVAEHFNNLVSMAQGEIVIIAAGDDISLHDRVSRTVRIFNAYPRSMIVSFTDIYINENGSEIIKSGNESDILKIVTLNEYIEGRAHFVSGASRGYKKEIFKMFKNLQSNCPTEDTPSLLRGLIIGDAIVSAAPGIMYRIHNSNLSNQKSLHAMNFESIKNQYICDATLAHNNNLLPLNTINSIKEWAENNFNKRTFDAELFNSKNKILYIISKLFSPNGVSFRLKLHALLGQLKTKYKIVRK